MIRELEIKNIKSIRQLKMSLGRVNVLIGENGSGKTNLLEAIALASAAAVDKLDPEFLSSRGIRVTEPSFMRAAFDQEPKEETSTIRLTADQEGTVAVTLTWKEGGTGSQWVKKGLAGNAETLLPGFYLYSPEKAVLRNVRSEGQVLPLGIKGEGLLAHLKALSAPKHLPLRKEIEEKLSLLSWLEGFEIPAGQELGLRIKDRNLPAGVFFDHRSVSESFLFLLFYFTLLISPDTPTFFALENIETSLNPRLCEALIRELVVLAKKHNKQVILTTHNPALLDGLELTDPEQKLFAIERDRHGHTRAIPIEAPKEIKGMPPTRLSDSFRRGAIGGLPKHF